MQKWTQAGQSMMPEASLFCTQGKKLFSVCIVMGKEGEEQRDVLERQNVQMDEGAV